MKRYVIPALLAAALLLSGCSMLNREYSSVQPHSASFYETEDRSVLRAESRQDFVNDLLLLIGSMETSGTVWLYPGTDTAVDPVQVAQQACQEVKQETPLGAYAVDYITYNVEEAARNYTPITLTISYRRTTEQMAAMAHATDVAALYDLLTQATIAHAPELVIQLGTSLQQQQQVQDTVEQVRKEQSVADSEPWQINFYPDNSNAGIIEILMQSDK